MQEWKESFANDKGEIVVSVAVPVQRMRAVLGVLLLSTRGGDIDDIVAATLFLASSGADYMTGQAINVTGGREMH